MTAGEEMDAASKGEGCLGRSAADEPVFILCARDPVASIVVRTWVVLSRWRGVREAKLAEADNLAERMDAWRLSGGGK